MSTLVLAEHRGDKLGGDTLSTITAAKALGGVISVLLTGQNVLPAAKHASTLQGIGQVCKSVELLPDTPGLTTLTGSTDQLYAG